MNLLFGLALLGALFAVLEGYWPAETGQRRLRGGLRTDLFYWFLTPLVTRPLTGVAIALGLVAAALLAGTPLSAEEISRFLAPHGLVQTLPRWVQVVAFFLLADLLGYLAHRLLHGRHLWLVHAVHHSSREVDWLSSVRAHPLNDLFTRSLQAVPLVLFGFDPALLVAWVPFLILYSLFLHANVPWDFGPLRYVVATPAFHRWHHAETDRTACNFAGLFPVWDLCFGTWHLPRSEAPPAYGIRNHDMPAGVLGQMAYPFRRRVAADLPKP